MMAAFSNCSPCHPATPSAGKAAVSSMHTAMGSCDVATGTSTIRNAARVSVPRVRTTARREPRVFTSRLAAVRRVRVADDFLAADLRAVDLRAVDLRAVDFLA